MFVGSFQADVDQFTREVDAVVKHFKASGVKNLLIDVTNNGGSCTLSTNARKSDPSGPGGDVYLGDFLYQYLVGTEAGFPYVHRIPNASVSLTEFFSGFQTTSRANPLAQKILQAGILQGHNRTISVYAPDNCKLSWTIIS
jgi:hypothetical protein